MTAGPLHPVPGSAVPVRHRWEFTDLEFKVLCDEYRRGRLPKPFTFTSRIRSAAEYCAEFERVRRSLLGSADAAFAAMAGALSRPDVIVVARGWDERDPQDAQSCTYVHAVRRDSRCFVVRQQMGETTDHSVGFDVAEYSAPQLPEIVVGCLPAMGAGARPQFAVDSRTGAPPAAGFFDTTATGTGYLRILQSRLSFQVPGILQTWAVWRDLPGDGRYLIRSDSGRSTVTGVDRQQLSGWLDGWIDRIVDRLDSGE
ncbi:ESX secretion-associated protein EspG [Nocardia flavorosea]|uniref:ESAT-6 protein secretion system EspG family protein n=1 Tax=Nocardia flavorosea TaxID=53429 RepID=A0A846YTR6_9NOCA|nr:ESX secretion-associated protein EspG [Nocardia flavorosea]NKY60864.1 hypothetical protein [Nocardia flavorosea]